MILEGTIKATKKDIEDFNFILNTDLADMTEEQKDLYECHPYDCIGLWEVNFPDGSYLTIDLASGDINYFDDVVWHSADGKRDITFDCSYKFGVDDEFEVDGTIYKTKWIIE